LAVRVSTRCREIGGSLRALWDKYSLVEHDFVWIHEDVLLRVGIADEVVEAATIEGQRVELLDGDAALVFDDAL